MRLSPRAPLTLAVALALIVPTALPAVSDVVPQDVALAGVATAASEFPAPHMVATNVNDGDPGTRWGSDYTHGDETPYPPSDHDPTNDWIQIELAEPSPVARVVINWEAAAATAYDIQVSIDGVTWETVDAVTNGGPGVREHLVDVVEPVSFVRMQGRGASPWGYSIFDFEIWDSLAAPEEEPDPDDWEFGEDVALFGEVSAASVWTGDTRRFRPENAVDGQPGTRWGSDYARDGVIEPPASDHDPSNDWIEVELTTAGPVWSVVLNWETARPSRYLVQVSEDEGVTWRTVEEVTGVAVGRVEHVLGLEETITHVRMQGVSTATTYGYSLWAFEVWSGPQAPPEPPAPGGVIVPAPVQHTEIDAEPFVLTEDSRIVYAGAGAAAEAELLAADLRPATGFDLPVVEGAAGAEDIALVIEDASRPELAAEGYWLTTGADGARIGAATAHGLFNGGRTLLQLLPPEIVGEALRPGPWEIAAAEVVDHPRYDYRGLMLDPARNFIELEDVLAIIDAFADVKGSRVHIHLTDDQGWRLEIPEWPRLTEVGGAMSMPGGRSGFYTLEDFETIVQYAAARHVEVIPEIDVPGHSTAAIAAYPELACGSTNTVCTTSATTDRWLEDVLDVLVEVSPSEFIHLGGDESISGQPYIDYIKKIEGMVMERDRRLVGWTPLPMADLDPSSVHQYWRDQSYEAEEWWFENDNEVILSPTAHAYLDYPYPTFDVAQTYNWDPTAVIDDYLSIPLQSLGLRDENVIGIEGPAWGENNGGGGVDVEHKVFPRIAALADLAWSPQSKTADVRSFYERLQVQGARWQFAGTNFWPDPEVPWTTHVAGTLHRTAEVEVGAVAVMAAPAVNPRIDGSVATIASPVAPLAAYSAVITWGDGSTSPGEIVGQDAAGKLGNSLFEVLGQHDYDGPGPWTGSVTVTGPAGAEWVVPLVVGAAEAEEPPTEEPTDGTEEPTDGTPGPTDPTGGADGTSGTTDDPDGQAGGSGQQGQLGDTGADVLGLVALGLLLVGLGVTGVVLARRRSAGLDG